MISSKTLRTFVKMHEYKLNAKVNSVKAGRLESRLDDRLRHKRGGHNARNWDGNSLSYRVNGNGINEDPNEDPTEHWDLQEVDAITQERPKSHYLEYILTTTRR